MTPEELTAKKQEIADARKTQMAAALSGNKTAFSAALQKERSTLVELKHRK
jgi:hypothetical protein